MFCKNCGNEISTNSKFCGACGQSIELEENNNQINNQKIGNSNISIEESNNDDQNILPEYKFIAPNFDSVENNASKPKKQKKKVVILSTVITSVVALFTLFAFNFNLLFGTAIKIFGSDSAYFKYVQTNAIKNNIDDITSLYDTVLNNISGEESKATGEISLDVSDDVQDLLELADIGIDVSKLDGSKIYWEANTKDSMSSAEMGLKLSNERIDFLKLISDLDKSTSYINIPVLTDEFISFDIDEFTGSTISVDQTFSTILESCPDEKTVNKLLERYVKIAIDNIDDVEKNKETLTINNIEQKCTVLEFNITEELLLDISEDILTEIKDDKEIKEIIEDAQKNIEKNDLFDNSEDLYDALMDEIDFALDEIDIQRDENVSDSSEITINTYVNNKHEIIGYQVEADGRELLFFATVKDGKKIATKFDCNEIKIEGTGTEKRNIINGDFNLKLDGMHLITITVTDFDKKEFENNGYLKGTFELKPEQELFNLLYGSGVTTASLTDFSIKFSADITDSKADAKLSLCNKNEPMISLNFSAESSKAEKVSVPDDVIKYNDEADIQTWVENFEDDKIISILNDLGIDQYLFEDLIDEIESSLSDDYYDDYDYDYEDDDYYDDYDYDYEYDDYYDDYDYDYEYDDYYDDYDYDYEDDDYYDDYDYDYEDDDYYDDYDYDYEDDDYYY